LLQSLSKQTNSVVFSGSCDLISLLPVLED